MPQFTPNSVHSATVTFANPKSAGFDYSASLCMGAALTEMARASFHLDAGQSKAIAFSVTMPSTPGTYPVYFKVTCGGVLIGTFVATEDVVITTPVIDLGEIQIIGINGQPFIEVGDIVVPMQGTPSQPDREIITATLHYGKLATPINFGIGGVKFTIQWRNKSHRFDQPSYGLGFSVMLKMWNPQPQGGYGYAGVIYRGAVRVSGEGVFDSEVTLSGPVGDGFWYTYHGVFDGLCGYGDWIDEGIDYGSYLGFYIKNLAKYNQ